MPTDLIAGLWHVTLTSGDVRWSPRTEVADTVIAEVAARIAAARRRGPAPIPGQPGYTARARARDGVLGLTVRAGGEPIVGMVVAPSLDAAREAEWWAMPPVSDLRPDPPPLPGPAAVCLAWLLPAIVTLDREALGWLGDYERCVAWAWLRGRQ